MLVRKSRLTAAEDAIADLRVEITRLNRSAVADAEKMDALDKSARGREGAGGAGGLIVADRPIIFSAPMVRALLDGRKTQTRRLIRCAQGADFHRQTEDRHYFGFNEPRDDGQCGVQLPQLPYAAGDRLYVREHWRADSQLNDIPPRDLSPGEPVLYDADGTIRTTGCAMIEAGKHRQGMHMPRWASRLTLTVEEVRVQRLQTISEEDAQAEGVERGVHPITGEIDGWKDYSIIHGGPHKGTRHPHAIAPWKSAALSFQSLWETLHGPESWAANPFVVALTFRVERGNIDNLGATS